MVAYTNNQQRKKEYIYSYILPAMRTVLLHCDSLPYLYVVFFSADALP